MKDRKSVTKARLTNLRNSSAACPHIHEIKDLEFYTEMIWGLGQDAKFIEPLEAVDYIKQKLDMLRLQYLSSSCKTFIYNVVTLFT